MNKNYHTQNVYSLQISISESDYFYAKSMGAKIILRRYVSNTDYRDCEHTVRMIEWRL